VLIRKGKNYQVFVLSEGKSKIDVSCQTSATLTEMKNKAAAPKLVGAYLLFHKNSKPTMAYYWARGTFQEVWMAE